MNDDEKKYELTYKNTDIVDFLKANVKPSVSF